MDKYDVVVIGSGPAGHGAAIQAAKLNKQVVLVEKGRALGGTSVNTGALPSKTLRQAVLYLTGFRQRNIYGISYIVKENITIQDLMLRTGQVIQNEVAVLRNQFSRNQVRLYEGEATFVGPHELEINGGHGSTRLEADYIVIAVGSMPARSEEVPINGHTIIDSDGVFQLPAIPRTMTIVGASAVGIEYACIFATLGTEVTLVDKRERVLEFVDSEILEALLYHMRQSGVVLRFGEEVTHCIEEENTVAAYTHSNKRITGQVLLYTVGRNGATQELGLESVNLEPDARGRVRVNENYQTDVEHIYAVGDVVGFPSLSSTSMEQGRVAACHALGIERTQSSSLLPYALYTIPEISMIGKTEEELTRGSVPYEIGIARYRETARGQIIGDASGTLKLLVHRQTRKLLGVHIIGEGAAELVHIGQSVIGLDGTVDFLVNNAFNYPTLAECYRIAALDAFNKLE